jgi:hypothetical protein
MMSNLLQSVLSSRLANATLGGAEASGEAGAEGGDGSAGRENLHDWEKVDSDEELVNVRSGVATAVGTPLEGSRPGSPTGGAVRSRLGVEAEAADGSGDAVSGGGAGQAGQARRGRALQTTDPLRAFGSEIAQQIFLRLPVDALVACSGVCRRWRRSATLNYAWYRHYQHAFATTSLDSALPPPPGWRSGGAKWTRRESKTDWKTQYAKQKRLDAKDAARSDSLPGSGTVTPSRSQRMHDAGILTTQEARMQQWQHEQDAQWSKQEMRDYYKSGARGGKFKGKREKGGVKTGAEGDGGLWQ